MHMYCGQKQTPQRVSASAFVMGQSVTKQTSVYNKLSLTQMIPRHQCYSYLYMGAILQWCIQTDSLVQIIDKYEHKHLLVQENGTNVHQNI